MPTLPVATPDSELLLNKLATKEDGGYYDLVKLRGPGVPEDPELYFCKNTFAVLQVRIKNLVPGEVHDYSVTPASVKPKGGVYELRCRRCAHDLQVKVQPPLGLLDMIKPPPYSSVEEVDAMLKRLKAVAGLFHILEAFQRDPTREHAPLSAAGAGATRHVGRLVSDGEVLEFFLAKCSLFMRTLDTQTPSLRITDSTSPKSRGMLLKALLEVKMLLVIAVEHFQSDEGQFTTQQLMQFHNFLIEIHEDCLSGGAEAQYMKVATTWESLKAIVCGPSEMTPEALENVKLNPASAWKALQDCVANLKNVVLPRLQQKGQAADLEMPSTDFSSAAGGAEFKLRYTRFWQRAIDAYLFDLVHSDQYSKGPEAGMLMIRSQWSRPDKALQLLCPSIALDKAIQDCKAELDTLLADKTVKRRNGVGKDGINFNPRSSTGLVNPGENLCAANALLQVLFSASPFQAAVLGAPEQADVSSTSAAGKMDQDAQQLVVGLRRLFSEMSHPDRACTCAREVAAALYGKELGQQQDCDELMHRLSLLVQEGLSAVPEKPFDALQQAFRRLFLGATYEMQLKASDGCSDSCDFQPIRPDREDSSNKQFLSIPVQECNNTLTQALEEFTSWSSTGGAEVAWTQERFRTLPPFLCFASRQVSTLEWEESLNLTRFVVPASSSMQRKLFERSRALQLQSDLKDTLEHLSPASRSLKKVNSSSGKSLAAEVDQLAKTLELLESRVTPLAGQITELERGIGDGFDEPSVDDFLNGVVDAATIRNVVHGRLAADTVKKLADLLFDGGKATEVLQKLVDDGALTKAASESIIAKLQKRWEEQHAHMYDLHAIIVYQGLGQFGHYIAYIRQSDGAFLRFDDEQVSELSGAPAVRSDIADRGSEGFPASVRMVVYRRRGAADAEPLELDTPQAKAAVTNGAAVNGSKHGRADSGSSCVGSGDAGADPAAARDAKRPRTQ